MTMQPTDTTDGQQRDASRSIRRARRFPGLLSVALLLVIVLLLMLLLPMINVSRFQHRISQSLSQSLGHTVHVDSVTLNLLPLPGFTFTNFVVDEDPAFGSEPIIRANSVRATLRLTSLWRRRIEFSTISFDQPSVNLVHLSNGKWNMESILFHAAQIHAAPTAQPKPGPTPRFPYIEATGARLNLKLDQEKTPFSLTDAKFSLWLPAPDTWHLRLKGTPARTDTDVADAGTIEVEGTLGRASSLGAVPLNLQGEWKEAPLGESTHLLFGRDLGIRGNLDLTATVQGTVNNSAIDARLRLIDARRADFVPSQPIQVDLDCTASARSDFHAFRNLQCTWPPVSSSSKPLVAISGDVPDVRNVGATTLEIGTPGIPAITLFNWLRVASARVPADVAVTGNLTGSIAWHPDPAAPTHWSGDLLLAGASLSMPDSASTSLISSDLSVESIDSFLAENPLGNGSHGKSSGSTPADAASGFNLMPVALALGGKEPAMLTGHFDHTGYTLHLTGMVTTSRLLALSTAIPQFGDGLVQVLPVSHTAAPYHVDLIATRAWHGPQTWTENAAHPPASHPHRPRGR